MFLSQSKRAILWQRHKIAAFQIHFSGILFSRNGNGTTLRYQQTEKKRNKKTYSMRLTGIIKAGLSDFGNLKFLWHIFSIIIHLHENR